MSDFLLPQKNKNKKKSQCNNRKDMLKKIHNDAENRQGAISRPEIEIPGRQKADGIKQVKKLEQKKLHSQTPQLGTVLSRDVLENIKT